MQQLDFIPMPWSFSPAGADCVLDDSLKAESLFKKAFDEKECIVVPAALSLRSLQYPWSLVWIYYSLKTEKLVSITPAFKIEDMDTFENSTVEELKVMNDTFYFYHGEELYCLAYTLNKQAVIRKVKGIFCETDKISVLQLLKADTVFDVYPSKLYVSGKNEPLCTIWSIEDETEHTFYWDLVSEDDKPLIENMDGKFLHNFPMSLGETALIGGKLFRLCYDKELGKYFETCNGARLYGNRKQTDNKTWKEPVKLLKMPDYDALRKSTHPKLKKNLSDEITHIIRFTPQKH